MAARKQSKGDKAHLGVLVTAVTKKGGAVRLSEPHGVWASYAVTGVCGAEPQELFYAGLKLPDGRCIGLFVNRENGLVVVDVVDKDGKGGVEVFRRLV